jgi:hypothetical protein
VDGVILDEREEEEGREERERERDRTGTRGRQEMLIYGRPRERQERAPSTP